MRSKVRGERVFGAALAALGVLALYQASSLPLGSLREPDAGFFPVVVAVTLTLFAALTLNSGQSETDSPEAESASPAGVWVLTALLAAYAWLLPSVGFVLCTAVLLGVLLRGLGGVGWLSTIMGAGAGAVGCDFLFTRLGMPLPSGLLGF
jgi:putative tricarboxylic transport membrane protein